MEDVKNKFLSKFNSDKKSFSGSSPPEIFVGRKNYPDIYAGILSPMQRGDTEILSSPESWFRKKSSIQEIKEYRESLIYSRFYINVKNASPENRLMHALNQVAMSSKSLSAEFFIKRAPAFSPIKESSVPLIGNPAYLENIKLEENPKISEKVEYITQDNRLKASEGISELYKSSTQTSSIIKILSAGLLGLKSQRKLVPTRWAITAVDNSLSKEMLKKIRYFPEISEITLFHNEYNGNHYEILLMPDKFSFEVIEISSLSLEHWHDYELFYSRKNYASSVTGAYYANRLALSEYLMKIKRQATAVFFREVKPEYNFPLGVGILRELTRDAFQKQPEKFQTISEAISAIQSRITIPVNNFTEKSILLKDYKKQKRLSSWFNSDNKPSIFKGTY